MGKINNKTIVVPSGTDKITGSDQSSTPVGATVNFTVDGIDKYFSGKRLTAPTTSVDTGVAGAHAIDSDYLYICVSTDNWKRIALSSF
jgi:hypothetical protein